MRSKLLRGRVGERGFTLTELMVVILIIGILMAIAIPTFLTLRQRAENRAAQTDLRTALVGAKAYFTDDETYDPAGPDVFDAADGEAVAPELDWVDGQPAASTNELGIAGVTATQVALVRHSDSGDTFCIADDSSEGAVRGVIPDPGGAIADFDACDQAADW